MRSRFWIAVEGVIAMEAMFFLWLFGVNVGLRGAMEISYIIVPGPVSLLRTLYGMVEFFTGIAFFIMLGRQAIPGGMKELLLMEVPLTKKIRYFPAILALGLIAGLTLDAISIISIFTQQGMFLYNTR